MRLKKLKKKYFDVGNVAVVGLRGRGKDVLFGNVIARSKHSYVSNLDYTNDNHDLTHYNIVRENKHQHHLNINQYYKDIPTYNNLIYN